MPTVTVTTNPIRLSQVITQSALIQNNGSGTLYLADNSSVSADAYALRVTPGATVSWPANSELWAVSDSSCAIGVLYGATGASVSQVTVAGPLTIGSVLAPVSVQGGGTKLYTQPNIPVPHGGTAVVTVPLPSSNLTYSAVLVYAYVKPNQFGASGGRVNLAFSTGHNVVVDDGSSGGGAVIAFPGLIQFSLPVTTDFPLIVTMTNPTTGDSLVDFTVWGIASAPPIPTTDAPYIQQYGAPSIAYTLTTNGQYTLPPTFTPLYLNIQTDGGSSLSSLGVDTAQGFSSTWTELNPNVLVRAGGATLGANTFLCVPVGGDGRSVRLRAGTVIGTVRLTLMFAPAPPNFPKPPLFVAPIPDPSYITNISGTAALFDEAFACLTLSLAASAPIPGYVPFATLPAVFAPAVNVAYGLARNETRGGIYVARVSGTGLMLGETLAASGGIIAGDFLTFTVSYSTQQ